MNFNSTRNGHGADVLFARLDSATPEVKAIAMQRTPANTPADEKNLCNILHRSQPKNIL